VGRLDYKRCKGCGRTRDVCGTLSHTRLCADCAESRVTENVIGLHTMSGPAVVRWRRGMAAAVGGVLVDDVLADLQARDVL